MKNFVKLKNYNTKFGSCANCEALCCKGSYGTIFSQILKEEFETIYEYFPILFIFGSLAYIKPVVLLSNGFDDCIYLKNNLCTIYENRPKVCKTYPLSPNIDNFIYIDNSCPEIKKGKNVLNLDDEIFKNYQEKYINTHFEFNSLKQEDFSCIFQIKGVKFYIYKKNTEDIFLNYHKLSLKNLDKFSFLNLNNLSIN